MSKIICDICGTSYPETSARCPICGTTRPEKSDIVYDDSADEGGIPVSYQYVKGGRFSKSNVRKRNNGVSAEEEELPAAELPQEEAEEEKSNKGLVITAIVLLLAIIAVAAYVAMRIWLPDTSIVAKPTDAATTAPAEILCTAINLSSEDVVTLEEAGAQWQLIVGVEPYNTTKTITYESEDESVCTVSDTGKLTAVGPGQTTVYIRCGEAVAQCSVISTAAGETTVSTQPTQAADVPADTSNFKISRSDFTLNAPGKSWTVTGSLAGAKVAGNQITWRSSNESVATVVDGKVTAVAPGAATIYAKYGDNEQSCIVRCVWKSSAATAGTVTEEGANDDSSYALNSNDFTLRLSSATKKYQLQLLKGNTTQEATFSSKNTAVCTVDNSGWVTAVGVGTTTVTATFNNQQYTCTVRVAN